MSQSTNLALPYLAASQSQKHVTVNEGLRFLDVLVQISVKSATLSAPPGSPGDGQRWIIGPAPTGLWAGRATQIPAWQDEGRMTRLVTAVSRGTRPHYVQDALRNEAAEVARLIRDGARVMVCGGRDMAAGVADALAEILAPTGLSPAVLKAEGRYVEDVY